MIQAIADRYGVAIPGAPNATQKGVLEPLLKSQVRYRVEKFGLTTVPRVA